MTDEPEDEEFVHQTAPEVAKRCLALLAVIERSYTEAPADLWGWADSTGISGWMTPYEIAYFSDSAPSEESRVVFSWRAEAMVSLLWAIQKVPSMPPLNQRVDLSDYLAVQHGAIDPEAFVAGSILRPAPELDEAEADLYHQHWRVRDAQLFRKPMPEELDPDIVYERRYGLSWVVGWGSHWDNVPTDT